MANHAILHEGVQIGEFRLDSIPGCSKVGVSHHLEIYVPWRGRGLGHVAQRERLALAKSLGFKVLLATVVGSNRAQERILSQAGWRRITFYEKVGNGDTVHLWLRNLADPYEEAGFFSKGGCR